MHTNASLATSITPKRSEHGRFRQSASRCRCDSTTPIGRGGVGADSAFGRATVAAPVRVVASTTAIDADPSPVTQNVFGSGVAAVARGRR